MKDIFVAIFFDIWFFCLIGSLQQFRSISKTLLQNRVILALSVRKIKKNILCLTSNIYFEILNFDVW